MDAKAHWETVYRTKRPNEVSWYRPHLDVSLQLIEEAAPQRDAQIIDVGGGEATLIDDLLASGYRGVSVLDLSATALDVAKARLGDRGNSVNWLCGDVTTFAFAQHQYDVWHDRAVFHFLTERADRDRYKVRLAEMLKRGGSAIIATFALDGPEKCSGLPVIRYSPETLTSELGREFVLVDSRHHLHTTPWGMTQAFQYSRFVRR